MQVSEFKSQMAYGPQKTGDPKCMLWFLHCVQKFWSDYLNLVIFGDFQNNLAENNLEFLNSLYLTEI